MKFRKATISGFAGVARAATVDLDAQVVVILGANGFGKSTICDAIAWTLTGVHPRGADPRSWYGSGETFVELEVVTTSGDAATIRRIVSNPGEESMKALKTSVIVRQRDKQLRAVDAERQLASWLQNAPADEQETSDPSASTGQTDSFYLQQDSLREFLASRSDDERFAALSQMVGARALSDLVSAFESASRAWTKSVKQESSEVDRLRSSVDVVRAEIVAAERRLEEARALGSPAIETWIARARHHVAPHVPTQEAIHEREPRAAASPSEIAQELEQGIAARVAIRGNLNRLQEQVDNAESRLSQPVAAESVSDTNVLELEEELRGLETARLQAVTAVEDAAARLQSAQTRSQELRALAELAIRHVSETCPTCGQDVDHDDLVARLRRSIQSSAEMGQDGEGERLAQANQARDAVLAAIRTTTSRLVEARAQRNAQQEAIASRERSEQALAALRSEMQRVIQLVVPANPEEESHSPVEATTEIDGWIMRANELLSEFRTMEPAFTLASNEERTSQLRDEAERRDAELQRAREGLEARQRTQALAEALLHGLRRDSESFLNERLRAIQPILEQLFAAIDPHPTLRGVALETRNWYGKNRLSAVLNDSAADVRVDDPGRTLSTSQANALAVTLFLAFNLGLQPTRVTAIILDDPLQNLDDVHLLGLVDLLRRVQSHRQIIVTTHDESFADLLARKMRPTSDGDRLSFIRLEAWDREGPRIVNEQMHVDPRPMKLVAG